MKRKVVLSRLLLVLIAPMLSIGVIRCGLTLFARVATADEIRYSDSEAAELVYGTDDEWYEGSGTSSYDNETIECDSFTVNKTYALTGTVPSYNNLMSYNNCCSVLSSTNVVAFYDRYYTSLIPDYEPGIVLSGNYCYYPSYDTTEVRTLMTNLYTAMNVNVDYVGATESDVKSGLKSYVNGQGYSLIYTSFYSTSTMLNLSKIRTMVANTKVGLIFCSSFNFVDSISTVSEGVLITKLNVASAHIMMVYGYITIDYYKDGSIFLTETYAQVSNGFSTGDTGYIKLNDDLSIVSAYIINIS